MNPIRKSTTGGATTEFDFDLYATQYLVKNLSGGDVTVSFTKDGEESWLIPDGAWQIIPAQENPVLLRQKVYIAATMTSATGRGVEVEAVRFKLPGGSGGYHA